jgi:glycosyltransferase involved in cell wall biosynthesis
MTAYMTERSIILYTALYPYGTKETFTATEVEHLCRAFDRVYILPYKVMGEPRPIPGNAEVVILPMDGPFKVGSLMLRNWRILLQVLKHELPAWRYYGKRPGFHWNDLLGRLWRSEVLEEWLESRPDRPGLHYSFWFTYWATILSLVKARGSYRLNFVCRILGHDFDVTRHAEGFLPYRRFEMRQVSAIAAISQFGKNTLRREYPWFHGVEVHYFGVEDNSVGPSPVLSEPYLVSCSNLIELKRVHLIVDILRGLQRPLRWVHFGDGPLRQDLERLAADLPPHIQVEWKGATANADILRYYQEHPGGIFLHPSRQEGGMPVAIMEALSFGMPVMGCDTGGVPEGVNEHTGFLTPVDFDPIAVATWIEALLEDTERLAGLRASARAYYEKHFQAEVAHGRFISGFLLPQMEAGKEH